MLHLDSLPGLAGPDLKGNPLLAIGRIPHAAGTGKSYGPEGPPRAYTMDVPPREGREMPSIGPEWIVVLLIVALLFGAKKIPELARSMGKASSEFKKGIKEGSAQAEDEPDQSAEPAKPAETPGAEA